MRYLDLSHWNKITDWDKIKDPVILKCTESTNYLDTTFKERQKILRDKGLYLGCYHFFRDVDPIKQADFYLFNSDWREGDILVLDFEINCTLPKESCKIFLDQVESKTGFRPWIYTNEARDIKYKLNAQWVAKYGTNSGNMQTPPKGDWKIWQYTSRGRIDGIMGNVDLNYAPDAISPELPISPTGENGFTKFSQNDSRWKDIKMGISNHKLGVWGCTTSSVATLGTWFGDTLTPKDYAISKNLYTKDGKIIWKQIETISKKIRFKWRYYAFSKEIIDEALNNPDTAVLLNVDRGYHWVSALSKRTGGYKCSDPYSFPAKDRFYANSEIEGFTVLIIK